MKIKLAFLSFFLAINTAYADNIEKDLPNFFDKIAGVMNSRDSDEIQKFYKYYSTPNSTFIKQSYYVDPQNEDKIIDQEILDMNRAQYIKYLADILYTPNRYAYEYQIKSTSYDPKTKVYLTLVDIKESYSRSHYDYTTKSDNDIIVFSASTCNFSLIYKNADISIAGMNCVEKIRKLDVKD